MANLFSLQGFHLTSPLGVPKIAESSRAVCLRPPSQYRHVLNRCAPRDAKAVATACRCRASAASTSFAGETEVSVFPDKLLFSYIVFDMDGTLTVSTIDFKLMRERTGIPEGDLFTVMDSWGDPGKVTAAHDTILELEAAACADLKLQPGLPELLSALRTHGAHIALVTRNTTDSVNAFFAAVGEEWRDLFSILLTREFRFVKPDKRLLLYVADEWGVDPAEMLMVGDSREDVECGKAAGTATCLISGGGNEVGADAVLGVQSSFQVSSLIQLRDILLRTSHNLPVHSASRNPRKLTNEEIVSCGLRFVDILLASGIIRAAFCSYPRLAGAFGGISASTREGDRVLHLQCGDGTLTKLLASQGMTVYGVDDDPQAVAAATRRGLLARSVKLGEPLLHDFLQLQPVDVVLSFSECIYVKAAPLDSLLHAKEHASAHIQTPFWATPEHADKIWQALALGGCFAAGCLIADVPVETSLSDASIVMEQSSRCFTDRGFTVSRQAVERWPEGILASLVVSKPGIMAFRM